LVSNLTGADQRGRAYGLYAMATGLGTTAGPAIGGWLHERLGPRAPFLANGVILSMCDLLLGMWLPEPQWQTSTGSVGEGHEMAAEPQPAALNALLDSDARHGIMEGLFGCLW